MATLLLCPILFLGILGIGSTNAKVCLNVPKYYNPKHYEELLRYTVKLLNQKIQIVNNKNLQETKQELHQALAKPEKDCKALYDQGIKKDGIYKISPSENCHVQVYCDMKNGGWTVIQRRQFGNVDFRRTWASYADGFGKLKGDHWLGLHYIHELTKNSPSKISFEFLMSSTHKMAVGIYRGFFIDGESAGFQMHVSKDAKYNSEMKKYIIGNGFYYHNGMMFSTLDRDNDAAKKDHCAKIHDNAGFWFNSCYTLAWVNGMFNRMYIYNGKPKKISRTLIKIKRE